MTTLKLFLATDSETFQITFLIARLFIGGCFVIHGLGKLGIVGSGNMAGFTGWLASMKIPFPAVQGRIAMLFELLGGIMIATGFIMRAGCLMCMSTMIVAALIGHKGGGYLLTNNPPGNEYTVNLAVICALFIAIGPGFYSVDYLLWR